MAKYRLRTVWHIEAPVAAVYAALCDPLRWPAWWPEVQQVKELASGDADGCGRILHFCWHGQLPYRLNFFICTTRMTPAVAVAGKVSGDLEGHGVCHFAQQGKITTIHHEWHVRTTRRWMNLLAPCASVLFKHNHQRAMQHCAAALAGQLNAQLLGVESTDLAPAVSPNRRYRLLASAAGLIAGTLATAIQMLLWWLTNHPVFATLIRDARLTAAIIVGPDALHPPNALDWNLIGLATLIHLGLCILYGLIFGELAGRWLKHKPTGPYLLAGGLFGMALYIINLYGFTALFPWFSIARDGITALTHLVFGLTLAGSLRSLCKAAKISEWQPA
jgi:hypothetical protein